MTDNSVESAVGTRHGAAILLLACFLYPVALFTGFLRGLTDWLFSLPLNGLIALMVLSIGINVAFRGYY